MSFNASALLLKKNDGVWCEDKVEINSVNDILKIFIPYENNVAQVNINKYLKVYYCVQFITDGIEARVTDMDCTTHYMSSPLLLVECDDDKPIKLSDEALKKLKDTIDFY